MAGSFFDEMKHRVGFLESDAERIRSLAPIIYPALCGVAEAFYKWLFEDPRARLVFSGGEEQIARQRRIFTRWLEELFSGQYDIAYYQKRVAIGHTHVRVNLPQHYMFTAMEVVWQQLTLVLLRDSVPGRDVQADLNSLHKLLTMELAIMLQSYKESYSSQIRDEERQVVEERLTRSEHLAQIGQLAASLAHEIKNPLAGISGAIQVIRDGMAPADPHRQVIREILGQIDRLDAAVKDLLVYARPKPPELKPCDLAAVVQGVMNLNRDVALLRHLEIIVDEQEGLPRVLADAGQFEQLMMNLLFNAAHACQPGARIRISLLTRGDYVRVLVADEGHGMDEATCARAMEPFFTTKAKGTGLGLPICRKIVEAHGGRMSLESEPGAGTTASVEFPIKGGVPPLDPPLTQTQTPLGVQGGTPP